MTNCIQCGEATGRERAKYCEHCRSRARGEYWKSRAKWTFTREIDAVIIEVWNSAAHRKKGARVVRLRAGIDYPNYVIRRRAVALGVARTYARERRWSKLECDLLREWAHLHPSSIAKKLERRTGIHRTIAAVAQQRQRMRLLGNRAWYTAEEAGLVLGFSRSTIGRYLRRGWLQAEKRELLRTEQQGGDSYAIRPAAIRRFVFAHPHLVDLCKVEKWEFLKVISGGKVKTPEEQWQEEHE